MHRQYVRWLNFAIKEWRNEGTLVFTCVNHAAKPCNYLARPEATKVTMLYRKMASRSKCERSSALWQRIVTHLGPEWMCREETNKQRIGCIVVHKIRMYLSTYKEKSCGLSVKLLEALKPSFRWKHWVGGCKWVCTYVPYSRWLWLWRSGLVGGCGGGCIN